MLTYNLDCNIQKGQDETFAVALGLGILSISQKGYDQAVLNFAAILLHVELIFQSI